MATTRERLKATILPGFRGEAPVGRGRRETAPIPSTTESVTAARRLNRAAGTIAASVLVDSAMEHYRGDFRN